MAAATPALAEAAPPAPGWRARLVELLLVGGATPLLFPLSWLARRALGLDAAEYAIGFTTFYAAFVINDPHFTVTYLLFYKDARGRAAGTSFTGWQRARWLLAGVVAPLALAAWAIAGLALRSPSILGGMIQLMFFLVGWHYVKQGFGVMAVLSARRGVRFAKAERIALLAHCYAGWAYAWASPYDPGREVEEKGLVYRTLAHPVGLERGTFWIFVASGVVVAALLLRKRLREGPLPVATPLVALVCSVWAWSIWSSVDPLVRYVIPALHSIQYLYFVWLLRAPEAREREGPPHFETSAKVRLGVLAVSALGLGWLLFHGAPTALDDLFTPRRSRFTDMGPTPFFAALYAFVNIHHYCMDAVIWRRENPETRWLAR